MNIIKSISYELDLGVWVLGIAFGYDSDYRV